MRFKPFGHHRDFVPHGLGLIGWSLVLAATIALAPFVIWVATRLAMLFGFLA